MADVSKIRVDGIDYDVKDTTIRNTVNGLNLRKLAYFGRDPVSSTDNDTVTNWLTFGSGYTYYISLDCINNQPSRYGLVIQYVTETDVFQLWIELANGSLYYRIGNAKGWWADSANAGTWRKLYDTNNLPLPTVTTADNGKVLKVVNGVWTAVSE